MSRDAESSTKEICGVVKSKHDSCFYGVMERDESPRTPQQHERLGYTPAALAKALGKGKTTIYRMIYAGKLKVCKIGIDSNIFIPKSEVDALLANVEVYNP